MKRTKLSIYTAAALLSGTLLGACKKDNAGFLSERLYYEQNPVVIAAGWEYRGIGLNPDGSTRPLTFKLLHIYDKSTGKTVDDIFFKKYPMQVWTGSFNSLTDTTLELVKRKLSTADMYPFNVEPTSGQVFTNYTTTNLPRGTYQFDLEISNLRGSKVYEKIGEFTLVDSTAFQGPKELNGTNTNTLYLRGDESKFQATTAPVVTIAHDPAGENKVVLKFVGKDDVPFNPLKGEIVRRPSGATFLQTFDNYTIRPQLFADRMEYFIPQFPFPTQSAGNGFNIYYRILSSAIEYDNPALNGWHTNPRFIQRLQKRGTYNITVKFLNLKHK